MWPVDELAVLNQCLPLTGNSLVTAVNDGSDEWRVGDAAWQSALETLFEAHDWGFLTKVAVLQRGGTPADPRYADFYEKPSDCMHVIWVRLAMSVGNDAPVQYMILNNQIILNAGGQLPPVPANIVRGVVTVKYVSNQNGPDKYSPLFIQTLRHFVKSGLYEGLNEDYGQASSEWQKGVALLAQARTRSDQEMPKRAPFNSRLAMSRRVRKPTFWTPPGWSDTGRPG